MARSLAFKLTLAFLLVSLIGVALVAFFVRQATIKEFERYLLDQRQADFVDAVTVHFEENNSWVGVGETLRQEGLLPAPQGQAPAPGQPLPIQPIVLADGRGNVVIPGGPFRAGDRVPRGEIERGVMIEVDGRLVGTVVDTIDPSRNPAEVKYLERTNSALLNAALIATGVAIILGFVLARTLTRPLRELTAAIRHVSTGSLEQKVLVRTQDELGELASAFNQMSAELNRSNELRRQMTADIAHDLRTPLAVIKGYAEALRDGDLPPTADTFQTMYQEAEHLSHLIDDLRTLSLADAGELALNCQLISPQELLERAAAAHRPQAQNQGITLQVTAAAGLPAVSVDAERMAQVLGNLVSNALRYTPAGGQITLAARRPADEVQLVVQDTGAGIPPADLPHIFERFYRGDGARQADEGESGLGLAIAKSLVEAHGGAIAVASTQGVGSEFVVSLPAVIQPVTPKNPILA